MIYFDKPTQYKILSRFAPLMVSRAFFLPGIRRVFCTPPICSVLWARPSMNSRPSLAETETGAPSKSPRPATGGGRIIFVGASTGGTEAVKTFLREFRRIARRSWLSSTCQNRSASFAARLNSLCLPQVIEARGSESLAAGTVYIAPGIRICGSNAVSRVIAPSCSTRRRSIAIARRTMSCLIHCAELVGRNAIGVILTGMGKDGACRLLRMRQAGARTFGQDEASCVVYGMPREAALIGAVRVRRARCAFSARPLNSRSSRWLMGLLGACRLDGDGGMTAVRLRCA